MDFLKPAPARPIVLGNMSEVTALTPIRWGRVPGERRTYEERLRFVVKALADKLEQGLPSELHLIHTLHFGRITILRPEQYLVYSELTGSAGPGIPDPVDDYPSADMPHPKQTHRSWVLTQVVFDGDVKAYFRDVADMLSTKFDAIFENCEDYPGTADFEAFWSWIATYQVQSDMFYCPYPNMSVPRIKQLEDFKRRFDVFLAKVRGPNGDRVENMDELFDAFVRESAAYASGFPARGGVYESRLSDKEGQ